MAPNGSALLATEATPSPLPTGAVTVSRNILNVLEAIGKSGPITRSELVADLSISDVRLKGTLDLLESQGWLRVRPSDGAYEYSRRVFSLLENAYVAGAETAEMNGIMEIVRGSGRLMATIGLFEAPGVFRIIDSTRENPNCGAKVSLVLNDLAIVAQSALGADALKSHVTAYQENSARPEEAAMIRRGEHQDFIASISEIGILWSAQDAAFYVPVRFCTGRVGAVGFEMRDAPSSIPLFLRQLANRILSRRDSGDASSGLTQIAHALRVFLEFDGYIDDPREV